MAQAALESSWGESSLTKEGNANGNCWDEVALFRGYASATDSFRDHGHFLKHNSRYAAAFDRVNLPLNVIVTSAGDPDRISDLAAARAAFQESTWPFWNHVRAVLCTIAFGSLCRALVAFGRVTAGRSRS